MLHILLAAAANAASGGGGGGGSPIVLTGATHIQTSSGTSCGSPVKFRVDWTYTGDPTGKTVTIQMDWNGYGFGTVATGVAASDGQKTNISGNGYWSKFEPLIPVRFKVIDESDSGNTATSSTTSSAWKDCGA